MYDELAWILHFHIWQPLVSALQIQQIFSYSDFLTEAKLEPAGLDKSSPAKSFINCDLT